MGGYPGAKEASSIAVDVLSESASMIESEESLEKAIGEIHQRILARSRELRFPNMGTTLAVVKKVGKIIIGNVGDSPVLLFRGNTMESIYEDDSNRYSDPMSMYGIIQYLGLDVHLDIHVRSMSWNPGDVILLCSDGITDNFLNADKGAEELASIVKLGSARKVVEKAIEMGIKPDDMTAVIVKLDS